MITVYVFCLGMITFGLGFLTGSLRQKSKSLTILVDVNHLVEDDIMNHARKALDLHFSGNTAGLIENSSSLLDSVHARTMDAINKTL